MTKIILVLVVCTMALFSYADEKKDVKNTSTTQEHIQMHEMMMKAHQEASDCLRAGILTTERCRDNFVAAREKVCGNKKCKEHMRDRESYKEDKKK